MALYWMPPSDPPPLAVENVDDLERAKAELTDWLLGSLSLPTHPVEVADETGGRRRAVEHHPHQVRSGRQRDARSGDRLPDLPSAGVRHRDRARHVDAVDFEVERRVARRRRHARLERVTPRCSDLD